MSKFWNWVNNELHINGPIAEDTWFDDEVTPELFKQELSQVKGDVVLWINSPGGDCIAASRIYTMLLEHKGNITVKIDGIAASAASVIAMAGTEVLMAPTAVMMIHNPLTVAIGDRTEMEKAIAILSEVKESIINAYELKTGLSREKIAGLMDAETWMNAKAAMEYGFCDGILGNTKAESEGTPMDCMTFSCRAITNSLANKLKNTKAITKPRHHVDDVLKRLTLLEM